MTQQFEASPWSPRDKLRRALWMLMGQPLMRCSFHNWYGYRAWLMRWFGATIGRDVRVRQTVRIDVPWQIELGDGVVVGDRVILYALGPITVGPRTMISQMAHLCAGTHDHTDPALPLLREPITIGADVWIAADAFVGPGVTIGDGSVLGARSSAFRDIPPGVVAVGLPAKPIGPREIGVRE